MPPIPANRSRTRRSAGGGGDWNGREVWIGSTRSVGSARPGEVRCPWVHYTLHTHGGTTSSYVVGQASTSLRKILTEGGIIKGKWDGVIELFAGAGGMTWGWARAGFRPVAAVDFDRTAVATHKANFDSLGCNSLVEDLTVFGPEQLEAEIGEIASGLLAVVGGPPCQGWSKAGRGKLRSLAGRPESLLDDPRNSLYRQFVAYVRYFQPAIFAMENVPGMLNLEGENVADAVVENFSVAGYRTEYALVNARWFGVPQDRQRLIFLGVRSDLKVHLHPRELEEFGPYFRTDIAGLTVDETVLRQALKDVPEVPHGIRQDPQPYLRPAGRLSRFAELMRAGCNGEIEDHVCRRHNDMDLEAFSLMPQGGIYADLPPRLQRYRTDIFPDKYRRLRWDGQSGTITAHLAKDCYQHIHPLQDRTISIREAARIQSFPDSFQFRGNMGDRYRQIGNAVPPLMAWGIAEYVGEEIDGVYWR